MQAVEQRVQVGQQRPDAPVLAMELDERWTFYPKPEAWRKHNPALPFATLRLWYKCVWQVEWKAFEHCVAWKTTKSDTERSICCVLVCPVTGQLFLSPSSYCSLGEAQQAAAVVALRKFVQVLGDGGQSLRVFHLTCAVDEVSLHLIWTLQNQASELPHHVQPSWNDTLEDSSTAATTVPISVDTISTPLIELEYMYQVSYCLLYTSPSPRDS